MKDVILRGRASKILAAKHKGYDGTYKPLVVILTDRDYQRLSPEKQDGLLKTRFSNERGSVYVAVAPGLYHCLEITARSRIRYYGFATPEEAIGFSIRNVCPLAILTMC